MREIVKVCFFECADEMPQLALPTSLARLFKKQIAEHRHRHSCRDCFRRAIVVIDHRGELIKRPESSLSLHDPILVVCCDLDDSGRWVLSLESPALNASAQLLCGTLALAVVHFLFQLAFEPRWSEHPVVSI